jgi:Protein of unknown function (DUF3102)
VANKTSGGTRKRAARSNRRSAKTTAVGRKPTLTQLKATANRNHKAVMASGTAMLDHAVEAGNALVAAKGLVKHGEWTPWLRENFNGSDRTAQVYMQVARNPQRAAVLKEGSIQRALLEISAPEPPRERNGTTATPQKKRTLLQKQPRPRVLLPELSDLGITKKESPHEAQRLAEIPADEFGEIIEKAVPTSLGAKVGTAVIVPADITDLVAKLIAVTDEEHVRDLLRRELSRESKQHGALVEMDATLMEEVKKGDNA